MEQVGEEISFSGLFSLCIHRAIKCLEVFYIEFDAGVRHDSLPHVAGVEEYILLVQGELKMVIGGKKILLQEKQSIRFGADVPHKYRNDSNKMCTVYNVIFYPDN